MQSHAAELALTHSESCCAHAGSWAGCFWFLVLLSGAEHWPAVMAALRLLPLESRLRVSWDVSLCSLLPDCVRGTQVCLLTFRLKPNAGPHQPLPQRCMQSWRTCSAAAALDDGLRLIY